MAHYDGNYERWFKTIPTTPTQVGGTHYDMPITPLEYITKNNLGFYEGNIVKYISEYKQRGGLIDLQKAADYLAILIKEVESGRNG